MKQKNTERGFTLIELLVSIAVLVLLTTISVIYFRRGGDVDVARLANTHLADSLRSAQAEAQGGVLYESSPGPPPVTRVPNSFGVYINKTSSEIIRYVNFDDDAAYGSGLELVVDDTVIEDLGGDIGLVSIKNDGVDVDQVSIVFEPPTATILVDGAQTVGSVAIELANTKPDPDISRMTTINRVTGRIDTPF